MSITADTRQGVMQARALGCSVRAIAREFGLTIHQVYSIIGQHRQPEWTPEPQQQQLRFSEDHRQ